MPSTATITSFYDFVPNTQIKSAEVNNNFGVFRGHILPVEPLTATSSHITYDLGVEGHAWRGIVGQYGTWVENDTTTSVPTPGSGYQALYFKSDGALYKKNSSGTETPVIVGLSDHGWTTTSAVLITATTTAPTKPSATIVVDKLWYARKGDTMKVRIEYRQTNNTSANSGSGDYLFIIPNGQSIDTTKMTVYATVEGDGTWVTNNVVGLATVVAGAIQGVGPITVYNATSVRMQLIYTDGATPSRGVLSSAAFGIASNAIVNYVATFEVPISGWS